MTNDFLDKAIADAKKKAEYHHAKSNEALGIDMTSDSLNDPKMKKRWDAYFKSSTSQKMKQMDIHMNASIHYEQVARNLQFIRMFNQHK